MVRIVTDSVADLPAGTARELGITVVPLVFELGGTSYRDGLDLTPESLYARLGGLDRLPVTSAPPPAAFAETCDTLAEEADAILIITLSSALSGTYNAAVQGRALVKCRCPVEVLDSRWAAMAQGFIVMEAARAAREGASLARVMEVARSTMGSVGFLAAFDTLEYLKRGGRIGAARALLGSLLRINPLIGLKDGAVYPAGRARSRAQAIERLYAFASSHRVIRGMAVENTACQDEADALVRRLGDLFPAERILQSRMTPAIGTHTGPGLLVVVVLGDKA